MSGDLLLPDRYEYALTFARAGVFCGVGVAIIGIILIILSFAEAGASLSMGIIAAVAGFAVAASSQVILAVISIERNTRATFRLLQAWKLSESAKDNVAIDQAPIALWHESPRRLPDVEEGYDKGW